MIKYEKLLQVFFINIFIYFAKKIEHKNIMDKFVQHSKNCNEIQDVIYGTEYKKLYDSSLDVSITLSLFTDGGKVTNSAKTQIWPLFGNVLELPPKMRFSQKNIIWFAIW